MQTVSVNAGKSDVDIEINLVCKVLYGAISLISSNGYEIKSAVIT